MRCVVPGFTAPSFAGLPPPPARRWRCFTFSCIAHCVFLFLFLHVGMLRPGTLRAPKLAFIAVQAPPPLNHRPQKIPPQLLRRATLQPEPPRQPARMDAPWIEVPAPDIVAPARPAPDLPRLLPAPQPRRTAEVVTGGFDSPSPNALAAGSSASPNAILPARRVQTGGFGDPDGLPADASNRSGQVTIAALGSFDLPSGPGNGNGSGGAIGDRAVVTSAGFGNRIARGDDRRRTEATVKDSGFAETVPVRKVAAREAVPQF